MLSFICTKSVEGEHRVGARKHPEVSWKIRQHRWAEVKQGVLSSLPWVLSPWLGLTAGICAVLLCTRCPQSCFIRCLHIAQSAHHRNNTEFGICFPFISSKVFLC